ncbi:MAG: hypothetical protein AAF996_04350 [Pseudomonadota bacterium]
MSSAEIIRRLKLRLGAVEAERYRLLQVLAEESDRGDFDAQASAALDAGDERLAREILRIKVDHASARSDAADAILDLDDEAEDLQALIALMEDKEEIDASLEDRLAKYEAALTAPETKREEG